MPSSRSDLRPILVLFRHDLRIADNRALSAAAEGGRPVIPAFVLDEESERVRTLGAARRWWLHHSIGRLGERLNALGARLVLRSGPMARIVDGLIEETGADTVFWNRRYEPADAGVDTKMKAALRGRGLTVESFDGQLLHEPSRLKTGSGGYYKVHTPFWRALSAELPPRDPVDPPKSLAGYDVDLASERLDDWDLLPRQPNWAEGFDAEWTPGEGGARKALEDFLDGPLEGYGDGRDIPAKPSTSRLSPHLAHGEITPFQIFSALETGALKASGDDIEKFRKEVAWREFSYHLLFHNPDLRARNYNGDFSAFPWSWNEKHLHAWRRGETGYPIVDAGMRQLWRTGWMHNRVRMIAASFLVKHLLIDWRDGEKWFWDTLVDADPANNPASWQWVAGTGADAAPYFRIFNPILQGEKFDPDGDYVRRYVPELARLPSKFIHKPWEASNSQLSDAGVKLGETYPVPVVDHAKARARALGAYEATRGTNEHHTDEPRRRRKE